MTKNMGFGNLNPGSKSQALPEARTPQSPGLSPPALPDLRRPLARSLSHRAEEGHPTSRLSCRVHSLLFMETARNAESGKQASAENWGGPSLGHKQLWLKGKGHVVFTRLPRPGPGTCLQVPGASHGDVHTHDHPS